MKSKPRQRYTAAPTLTQLSDQETGEAIEAVFKHHRRRYGYRRIWQELNDQGIICAPDRVRRLMAERGLKALQPKTYVPRTSDGRADKPSPNLLLDQPLPDKPNQAWAGDIALRACFWVAKDTLRSATCQLRKSRALSGRITACSSPAHPANAAAQRP